MKRRVLTSGALLLVLLFLGACGSGVSGEQYDTLAAKYEALRGEHDTLQEEHSTLKSELADAQKEIQEYESRLEVAHAYAQFFDVYVDTFRWASGLPTKYGYAGHENSHEYLEGFYTLASEAGGDDFAERIVKAFSLPKGDEKDKAWAEYHTHLAENLLEATSH